MSVTIADVILLPDNTPMEGGNVILTCISSPVILPGVSLSIPFTDDGAVTFDLVNGIFEIRLIQSMCSQEIEVFSSKVEVTDALPPNLTLVELVNNHKYVEA